MLQSKLDTAGFGPTTLELHVLTLDIIKLLFHPVCFSNLVQEQIVE